MEIYNYNSYFQVFSTVTIIYGATDYLRNKLLGVLTERITEDLEYYEAQKSIIEFEDTNGEKEYKGIEETTYQLLRGEIQSVNDEIDDNRNLLDFFEPSITLVSLYCLSLLVIGGIQEEYKDISFNLVSFSIIIASFVLLCILVNFIRSYIEINNFKEVERRKNLKNLILYFLAFLVFIGISFWLNICCNLSLYSYFSNEVWAHILLLVTPLSIYLFSAIRLFSFGSGVYKKMEKLKITANTITELSKKRNQVQ